MLFKHGKTYTRLSADGRLLHTFGPEVEKLLSLNRVLVRGTTQVLMSAEGR